MNIKLMHDPISREEIEAVHRCLASGYYTQGKVVEEFEKKFAEWNSSKYAVMVNSGSSANFLIISLLKEKFKLKKNDEVLVPSITWPTMVAPLIQQNLSPVFCDIDTTFNISLNSIKKMYTSNTKAIFVVHLLGQPADIVEIEKFCRSRNILLIEDCCEAMGAKINGKKVGNFGIMGSFSFYFGHHMTTIEGGMITTNDYEIYDILKSLRSHGWIRNSNRIKEYEKEYPSLDFIFDHLGYNMKSTNINASIGIEQIKKVDKSIEIRNKNHKRFNELISLNKFIRVQEVDYNKMSSFCLPILLPSSKERDLLMKQLPKEGIECRNIIGGNMLKQPIFLKKLNGKYRTDDCINADIIHHCGMYLPNNQFITEDAVEYMVKKVNEILNYKNDEPT